MKRRTSARRPAAKNAGSRVAAAPGDEFSPPVSRVKLALCGAVLGLCAGLVHWFDGPRELVWILAVCAALYAVLMLMPDRIRRLLAWDLNSW